jgi:hypothetical protein
MKRHAKRYTLATNQLKEDVIKYATKRKRKLCAHARRTSNYKQITRHVYQFIHVIKRIRVVVLIYAQRKVMAHYVNVQMDLN